MIYTIHLSFHDSLLHNIARGHLHSIECSRIYTWSSTIKRSWLVIVCVCPSVHQVVKLPTAWLATRLFLVLLLSSPSESPWEVQQKEKVISLCLARFPQLFAGWCAPQIDGMGRDQATSSATYFSCMLSSQASCVIVSGFRAALDLDTYPLSNFIRPRCAERVSQCSLCIYAFSACFHAMSLERSR